MVIILLRPKVVWLHIYIYDSTFNPDMIFQNLIEQDYSDDDGGQFLSGLLLQTMTTYTLVVTPSDEAVTGAFSIIVSDPASVGFILQ